MQNKWRNPLSWKGIYFKHVLEEEGRVSEREANLI